MVLMIDQEALKDKGNVLFSAPDTVA